MQIHSKKTGVSGVVTVWNDALRFKHMIKPEAQKRARILTFFHEHGLLATRDAFKVSRATLYRWQSKLRSKKGRLEALNALSRAPRKKRKRVVPREVREFLLRMRREHYRIGKDMLAPMLKDEGIADLSASTVGRILQGLKEQGALPTYRKLSFQGTTGRLTLAGHKPLHPKRRLKHYHPAKEGDLLQIDTIVRYKDGLKRYVVTAIDVYGKCAFAYAYKSPSSLYARDLFQKLETVVPFTMTRLQTDNGSEFAKYFREYVASSGTLHFHTYPRTPKMNAVVERFNRTIQEDFVNKNAQLLAYDLEHFNKELMEWLIWYNTKRPHSSLGYLPPLKFFVRNLVPEKSQMIWTNTCT